VYTDSASYLIFFIHLGVAETWPCTLVTDHI